MLREGPIPRFVHGLIEYVVGVFLVAAPFLLGFDDLNMPLGVAIATGVVILVLAAITEGPTGLVHQLPVSAHVTFDFLLAIFLIAAPFILGFGDEAAPRNLFIALGVAHLLISIGTRYRESVPDGDAPARRAKQPAASPAPRSTPSAPPTSPTRPSPDASGRSTPAGPPASPGTGSSAVDSPGQDKRAVPDPPPTPPST